jgi:hypothetical protein
MISHCMNLGVKTVVHHFKDGSGIVITLCPCCKKFSLFAEGVYKCVCVCVCGRGGF